MERHPFLSPAWIEAAKKTRASFGGRLPAPTVRTRVNVVVTDIPHGASDTLEGHIDTTSGETVTEEGHLDSPDLTVTLDYATARAAFVERDPQRLMQSFMTGKILVEGDIAALMALQSPPPEGAEVLEEMQEQIESFTV